MYILFENKCSVQPKLLNQTPW